MLGRRELMDAVPQVKNMCRPRAHRVCVRLAKTVEHAQDFLLNTRWRRKQNMRVNIALQSLSGAAHFAAYQGPCLPQIHGTVQAQHFAVQGVHLTEPQATALGEDQPRNGLSRCASFEFGQDLNWSVSARWNFGSGFPFTQTQGFYENVSLGNSLNENYTQTNGILGTSYGELIKDVCKHIIV